MKKLEATARFSDVAVGVMRGIGAVAVMTIPLLACSSSSKADPETPDAAATEPVCPTPVAGPDDTDCTAPLAPGQDRTCTFTYGGAKRKFLIYAPATYNPCAPTALVIDAHGAGETAEMHAGLEAFKVWPNGLGSGWRVVADKEGFVVVTPQSINDFVDGTDVPFLFKVEEMASAVMNVDPAKVFMTGISNGGFFSFTAACDAKGSVFTGVAPVSGGNRSARCPLSKPTPYIGFNSKTDTVIPYDNGVAGATLWEKTNHCKSGPTKTISFGGPNTDTRELCLSSGPGFAPPFKLAACSDKSSVTTCETWDGCDGDVKVTFCTVNAAKQLVGGHILYFNDSKLSLAAVAWEFFKGTL